MTDNEPVSGLRTAYTEDMFRIVDEGTGEIQVKPELVPVENRGGTGSEEPPVPREQQRREAKPVLSIHHGAPD